MGQGSTTCNYNKSNIHKLQQNCKCFTRCQAFAQCANINKMHDVDTTSTACYRTGNRNICKHETDLTTWSNTQNIRQMAYHIHKKDKTIIRERVKQGEVAQLIGEQGAIANSGSSKNLARKDSRIFKCCYGCINLFILSSFVQTFVHMKRRNIWVIWAKWPDSQMNP